MEIFHGPQLFWGQLLPGFQDGGWRGNSCSLGRHPVGGVIEQLGPGRISNREFHRSWSCPLRQGISSLASLEEPCSSAALPHRLKDLPTLILSVVEVVASRSIEPVPMGCGIDKPVSQMGSQAPARRVVGGNDRGRQPSRPGAIDSNELLGGEGDFWGRSGHWEKS